MLPPVTLVIDLLNRQNPYADRKIKGLHAANLPIRFRTEDYPSLPYSSTKHLPTINPSIEGGRLVSSPRYNQWHHEARLGDRGVVSGLIFHEE